MRTTVTIDDELLKQAMDISGLTERPTLIRESLRALIEREASRRLAALGGSQPNIEIPPRRRPEPFDG